MAVSASSIVARNPKAALIRADVGSPVGPISFAAPLFVGIERRYGLVPAVGEPRPLDARAPAQKVS